MDFKEWFESRDDIGCLIGLDGYAAEEAWNARQAEIDALKAKVDIFEKLRDSQFDKLWGLTQAIEVARNGADEDFDLFLNHLSNILKGEQK